MAYNINLSVNSNSSSVEYIFPLDINKQMEKVALIVRAQIHYIFLHIQSNINNNTIFKCSNNNSTRVTTVLSAFANIYEYLETETEKDDKYFIKPDNHDRFNKFTVFYKGKNKELSLEFELNERKISVQISFI